MYQDDVRYASGLSASRWMQQTPSKNMCDQRAGDGSEEAGGEEPHKHDDQLGLQCTFSFEDLVHPCTMYVVNMLSLR
jgi:hypothetical protein